MLNWWIIKTQTFLATLHHLQQQPQVYSLIMTNLATNLATNIATNLATIQLKTKFRTRNITIQ